jgi:pimeloyl-ACP methyl ester carboxylesterase
MDLPAYGLTGPNTSGDYSPEYYVKFMQHFLEKLGVKKCIIAGNSLGGAIAWRYALRYPTAVSKLILIDAAGYPMESKSVPVAFQLAGMPVLKNLFQYVTPRFIVQYSIENVYADKSKVEPALVDRYFNLALRAGNRQAFIERMSTFKTVLTDSTYLQIKTIKTPTLILWGDKDLLIPVTVAENFHADLPNDTLVVLKNLGHTPMEENPIKTLQVFNSFLNKK